jgi:hypothetical protein
MLTGLNHCNCFKRFEFFGKNMCSGRASTEPEALESSLLRQLSSCTICQRLAMSEPALREFEQAAQGGRLGFRSSLKQDMASKTAVLDNKRDYRMREQFTHFGPPLNPNILS